jgi:hypothetical protein
MDFKDDDGDRASELQRVREFNAIYRDLPRSTGAGATVRSRR